MPRLTVWQCPVCGAESDPAEGTPANWISVSASPNLGEVFDTWNCVAQYAQSTTAATPTA
jgi:rubredoxin